MIGSNRSATKITHPWSFRCERPGCFWITAHKTEQNAIDQQAKHEKETCPLTGGDTYLMAETDEKGQQYTQPHLNKSILEDLWDELDKTYDTLSREHGPIPQENLKGRARGIAFAIKLMSKPYFETIEDVVKEAVKRKHIRDGAKPWEPTPGYKFNPPPPGTITRSAPMVEAPKERMGTSRGTNPNTGRPSRRGYEKKKDLPAEAIAGIKQAVESGMFTEESVASIFKVTPEQVKQALAS